MFVYNRVSVRKNKNFKQAIATAFNVRTAALSIVGALTLSVATPVITMAAPVDGSNNDPTVTTNEVAGALQDTAGILSQSDSIKTTSDSDSAIKAATAGASIDVPKDASDGVTLASNGGPSLDIKLPNASQAKDAQPVAPGVVSYPSNNGSANAVQATEDGGVRMLTVIDNPNAPTAYDYKVDMPAGSSTVLTSDGGALILDENRQAIVSIDAPWAKDADGRKISTWFTTDGQKLTQHVRHNVEGVVYPVTADPRYSWAWNGVTIYLSRNETRAVGVGVGGVAAYLGWTGIAGVAAYSVGAAAQWAADHGYCLAVYKNYFQTWPKFWTFKC